MCTWENARVILAEGSIIIPGLMCRVAIPWPCSRSCKGLSSVNTIFYVTNCTGGVCSGFSVSVMSACELLISSWCEPISSFFYQSALMVKIWCRCWLTVALWKWSHTPWNYFSHTQCPTQKWATWVRACSCAKFKTRWNFLPILKIVTGMYCKAACRHVWLLLSRLPVFYF